MGKCRRSGIFPQKSSNLYRAEGPWCPSWSGLRHHSRGGGNDSKALRPDGWKLTHPGEIGIYWVEERQAKAIKRARRRNTDRG